MLGRSAMTVMWPLVLVGTGACSFANTAASEQPDAATTGQEGGDGEMPVGVVACETPDPSGLVVCLEFEDSMADGVLDDSSPARRDATATGVAQLDDPARDGMTMEVGAEAAAYVAQSPALDLATGYTLAAWIKPATLPAAGTARGVLDHEGQYAMIVSVTASGAIHNRCQHAGVSRYEYTERLASSTWSFLACTWDGTQFCAYRWTSPADHERYCHTPALGPSATGSQGLAVGHLSSGGAPHGRFDGALDSVQVYSRGMTEPELCALIGQPAGCLPCDACL